MVGGGAMNDVSITKEHEKKERKKKGGRNRKNDKEGRFKIYDP